MFLCIAFKHDATNMIKAVSKDDYNQLSDLRNIRVQPQISYLPGRWNKVCECEQTSPGAIDQAALEPKEAVVRSFCPIQQGKQRGSCAIQGQRIFPVGPLTNYE